jgi:glycosyltransferase involved in cell wall biosynthesis
MTLTVLRVYGRAVEEDADAYHFHDPELIPIGLLLRLRGKEVVYDVHEDLPKDILSKHYLPPWLRPLLAQLVGRFEKSACRRFSALVTATPSIATRFRAIDKPLEIVHNYPYASEVDAEGQSTPWECRRQSVAYVGGISRQRSAFEMVAAMSLLPTGMAGTLELAGNEKPEGIDPEVLHRHPGWTRVKHHGFLDQPRVFHLLHQVRAGLVLFHPEPNHFEAIPQKIFEYMGAGIPIIASDFPYWRQMFGDVGCAIFVDPLDPPGIAQAIELF